MQKDFGVILSNPPSYGIIDQASLGIFRTMFSVIYLARDELSAWHDYRFLYASPGKQILRMHAFDAFLAVPHSGLSRHLGLEPQQVFEGHTQSWNISEAPFLCLMIVFEPGIPETSPDVWPC